MKRFTLAITALMTLLTLFGGYAQAEDGPSMKAYYLALLYKGPAWTAESTEATQQLQVAHMANIGRMAESGDLLLAGPADSEQGLQGIFIFEVDSLERAQELCNTDPAIQAGRLRAEVHTWWAIDGITHPSHANYPKKDPSPETLK